MVETMYDAEGAGLAAPQVGVQKRVFVYDVGDGPEVLINPEIVESEGEWYHDEGCLSIPGLRLGIIRPQRVHLRGLDLDGNERSLEGEDFLGRVFQHEVDHLDGVLMVERLDEDMRKQALRVLPRPGARSRHLGHGGQVGLGRQRPRDLTRRWAPVVPASSGPGTSSAAGDGPPGVPRHPRGRRRPPADARGGRPRRGPGGDPTRPAAREGNALIPSPVKAAAQECGLAVTDDLHDATAVGAELGVVVAYGRIVPVSVLEVLPMVNLHFSLLPRWRGAAPVERAILEGDSETGVCLMAVEVGLDTGAIYAEVSTPIGEEETADELRVRLVAIGCSLLEEHLAGGRGGLPAPREQAGTPSYAEKLLPHELELDWQRPALHLRRVVRLGRAWTTFRGRRVRILSAAAAPRGAGHRPRRRPARPGCVARCGGRRR